MSLLSAHRNWFPTAVLPVGPSRMTWSLDNFLEKTNIGERALPEALTITDTVNI
jgi:hypothetical protein